MSTVSLVFPHQLFEKSSLPFDEGEVYLVEEPLFFTQYNFHKQKLAFMRASMKFYENFLKEKGVKVWYISCQQKESDIRELFPRLSKEGVTEVHCIDPTDDWLRQRLKSSGSEYGVSLKMHSSPLFMNSRREIENYFADKKRFYHADFYTDQRKKRKLLLEGDKKPLGGKWSFDAENRKKYPAGKNPPRLRFPEQNDYYQEAVTYVEKNFGDNHGSLSNKPLYPVTHESAVGWMENFFAERFTEFGPYEDAMVAGESILHHSVLSPLLNNGLLTPQQVLDAALQYSSKNEIPLNSLEGFVRQIVGWREFIRAMYELKGREERTLNFWGFYRKIPDSFYDGTTGIDPVDIVIKRVLKTGYCHHIERLMVLGNFMLLCEFDPDEVYRWFMELFIDAWDWVMVPNVYGMSQFADGGLMSTKPYFSGSNYLMKMSDFPKGDWQRTWDGLFWRFMDQHRDFFGKNPRMGMLLRTLEKMDEEKREAHFSNAENFLNQLNV